MACRGFSSLITSMPLDCAPEVCSADGVLVPNNAVCGQTVAHWLFWVLLLVIIITAVWSANYLNKAMMYYGNTEVVPIYYCTFTLASIIGCAVVYNELKKITILKGIGFLCGVVGALSGVLMLMSGRAPKEEDMPAEDEEEEPLPVMIMVSGKFSSPSHRKSVGARRSRKRTSVSFDISSTASGGRGKVESDFSSCPSGPEERSSQERRPPAPSIAEESDGKMVASDEEPNAL